MRSRTKNSRSMAARDRRRVAGPWHVPASEPPFFNCQGRQAPTAGPLAGLVFPMLESVVFLLSLMVLSMPVQAQTPSATPAPAPTPTVIPSKPIQIQPPAPTPSVIPSQPIQMQPVQIEKGPTVTITGVQPVNPSVSPLLSPTQPLQLEHPWGILQAQHGRLACSDPALSNACGYETADKLGTYKLDMNCSDGFYDPIWGGTCWKCPAGDGWIRSANNIQNDDACWRVPKETTAAAHGSRIRHGHGSARPGASGTATIGAHAGSVPPRNRGERHMPSGIAGRAPRRSMRPGPPLLSSSTAARRHSRRSTTRR